MILFPWKVLGSVFFTMAAMAAIETPGYLPVLVIPGFIDPYKHLQVVCDRISNAHPGTNCTLIQPQHGYTSTLPLWVLYEIYLPHVLAHFKANPNGIHVIGHSQGALIARAIIQKTPDHPVKVFISVASPQMGLFGVPDMLKRFPFARWLRTSSVFRNVMDWMFYSWLNQHALSIASFWKDPYDIDWYLKSNEFLPIVNNEIDHPEKETFKESFEKLSTFVAIGGPDDGVVKPWQSSQLEYYDKEGNIVPLKEQEMYINNTFGIRTLDESGRFFRHVVHNTTHNGFIDDPYTTEHLIIKYLT